MVTYDQWKCTDPREYEPEPEECPCENFDIDWSGYATCDSCGRGWFASPEECEAQRRHEEEYAKWVAEQERPWNRFKEWLHAHMPRWPRFLARPASGDDEIPF